jgi:acetylornithine deacetylase/succinyl-diaminopimelate desuccinylase-like protein
LPCQLEGKQLNLVRSTSRELAIARAVDYFESGALKTDLARRVAIVTAGRLDWAAELFQYLESEMMPAFEALGFECRLMQVPQVRRPFLFAARVENNALPTVFSYAHGDVIQGLDAEWNQGLTPWKLTESNGRYYGRGVADNKGQHTINLGALAAVLRTRGYLGFNMKWLIEMGEETGSPGLRELCSQYRDLFAADVLIASDGPRLSADRPSIFLGTRGAYPIDFWIESRDEAHHSGNWGGLLSSPSIQLVNALSSIVSPTGQVRIPEWVPASIPDSARRLLAGCEVRAGPNDPVIDPDWGEAGLTLAEKLFAWSAFEILAMTAGSPDDPVNSVPPRAWARGQLRYVVGVDPNQILAALRRHLDGHGFTMVQVAQARDTFPATRVDPENPWVRWTATSMRATTGREPAILPNFGGSLPNDVFVEGLKIPTLWIPHSYPGCLQHAPNEHLPLESIRQGLEVMAGIYWDLGEPGVPANTCSCVTENPSSGE